MSTEGPIPPFAALAGSAHSWSEDFTGENGNYENRCTVCENHFIGHKRRLVCKVCATEAARKWEAMSEDERQKSIARTREELAKWAVDVYVRGKWVGAYEYRTREEAETDAAARTRDFRVLGCRYKTRPIAGDERREGENRERSH